MNVAHVITGLGVGGAETSLMRLLSSLDRDSCRSKVISLSGNVVMGEKIERLGVEVRTLGMRRALPSPRALMSLRDELRRFDADVVQTWMYHADLMGGLAARLSRRPVVWSLRQSNLSGSVNRATTMLVMWTNARLSDRIPERIVCGSEAALRSHRAIGYSERRMKVISNGFDTRLFRPDASQGEEVRRELSVEDEMLVVGHVARFDPQKDHRTFVDAAKRIADRVGHVLFVMCGDGVDESNVELGRWIGEAGLNERVRLLGRRDDLPRLLNGFDVAVSSSIGEGLPNAVGEAMAMSVPCVVTDVGDTARLVGETGVVVEPSNAVDLADAVVSVLNEGEVQRRDRGLRARRRIEQEFSLETASRAHLALWQEVAQCAG